MGSVVTALALRRLRGQLNIKHDVLIYNSFREGPIYDRTSLMVHVEDERW